jgi:uncharacterized protein YidB (DUF937 family)
MGFLDIASMLMGDGGVENIITEALTKHHGGLQGIVDTLHQTGLSDALASWVGDDKNIQITHDMLEKIVGSEAVQNFAASTGLPVDLIVSQLGEHLPNIIHKAVANGTIRATPVTA